MGNSHSRPEERFRYINREVSALQWSLKTSRQNISKAKKESIVENLAHYSSEIISMNGRLKRKNIEETLKKISDTMEEVLKIEPTELDGGTIESDSFVNVPVNQKRSSSLGSLISSKKGSKIQEPVNRNSLPTLRDIEAKANELKTQINTAIDNKDSAQLRVYLKTVKVLATDLESIKTDRDSLLNKRKESVGKKIGALHQKVIRAQNELKRDDKLRTQTTQNKKEKALSELADIEIQLTQNESLLDKLIKEKNSSDFTAIRNNIVKNNQKLAKVDIVDNEVKEKVVLLSQKLTETVKTLDRIMAKREFESKFNKSLETYDRIIRNYDPKINIEDTVDNLHNLRNSVENIEDINEITRNRKKDLLNNISYQIDTMEKDTDKKIVEEIVEDNVILRKKVQKSNKEHTVIDQFINHWINVKTNFNVNAYSNLSLLRIDSVLEEMQQSISELRIDIARKCETNPPTNLSRKHSQSLPRLNTRKSYDSLDQLDGKIIKTRAKMYNLSTPELQDVTKQERNNYVNKRFSKIEEIKMQVHYIKEKIDESHNKNLLKDKLEHYRRNLETYTNDANKTVQNNAIFVSNEIIELLHKLVLSEFSERIAVFSKRVFNFNGTRYDKEYDEMKQNLIETQLNLEAFNIPSQFNSLLQEKNELLEKLANSLDSLQEKTLHYRKPEDEHVKGIKAKLQELSEKISRFSGSYKDVLYNSIERDLNKLLLIVGEQVEDRSWTDELTKETEKLLKILENRASRAQSFRVTKSDESKSEEQIGMIKIKQDLYNIKREIDRTHDSNVEAFIGLQSRLDLVNLELSQISARSNENLAKEKDIFSNEAQTLKNVVDAKVALGQQPVQWPERELQTDLTTYPKNDVNKEIEQFEQAFEEIKRKITAPNNEQDVHKSYKLAQDIKILQEKLSKYKFIRNTDLHTRQAALIREMQYYIEELEKGATDINYVLSIEKKLDKLENLFDDDKQQDLKTMAKELQAIQRKLKDHDFITPNEVLRIRKTSVQQKTDGLAQKLKDIEVQKIKIIDDVEETVNDIAPQVMAFTGTKNDNKYIELKEATTTAISNLDKIESANDQVQQRKQKLIKDLHILEYNLNERAQQTLEIINIEMALNEVSLSLNNFSGKQEELVLIKDKMDAIRKQLQGLKVVNELIGRKNACTEKFSVLFNKTMALNSVTAPATNIVKHSQTNYSLGNVTYATSSIMTITEQSHNGVVGSLNDESDELIKIEQKINEIELATNNNSNDINKLQEFDENLTQYTIQIGKLNYTKSSPHYPKVLELYQRIETITDVIEAKMQVHDRLAAISHEVDQISNQMNTPLTYEQIDQLDERLIQLQITLGKMNNTEMKAQIDGCMLRIILCLQKISEYKASVQGTAV